ncbi:hypothetical protein ACSNOB_26335 [Micromonospora sp. URMC 106]|uniref:hypothetical protein n=1 Tax=Micromonospora sp. URMC 106 TaxID=3423408 RepID=UPI003F1D68A7
MAESDNVRERSGAGQPNPWAWPVGIMLGLVTGLVALDGAAGVGLGIGIGVTFVLAFGTGQPRAQRFAGQS